MNVEQKRLAEQKARAAEKCHCSHLRSYHDPCSVCECAYFRDIAKVKAKTYKLRPVPPEDD